LAAQQPVPKKEELKYKPASEYRYIGKDVPTVTAMTFAPGEEHLASTPDAGHGVCVDRALTGARRKDEEL
jgi:hypothetical protein